MIFYWLCAILSSIKQLDLFTLQIVVLIAITAYYFIVNRSEKLATQLLWAYLTLPIFFINISVYFYLPLVTFLTIWAVWLYKRPNYDLPFDRSNIIIAFYKGENCSAKMRFWALLDMPVSSMCIINSGKVLMIKNKTYVVEDSINILNNKNYIKFDTGIKANNAILNHMRKFEGMHNHSSLFYSDCIESVSSLLYDIDPSLKPNNWLETRPSVYFRKVLNGRG